MRADFYEFHPALTLTRWANTRTLLSSEFVTVRKVPFFESFGKVSFLQPDSSSIMAELSTAAAPPAGKTVAVAAATAIPTTAIVHPLVLLSATDHYMRVAKDTKKRVVGVLLGSKEVAGERDTWKTTTHENAVRTRPAHDAPQSLVAKMCGRNVLLECFRQHKHLSMLQCMLKWMGGRDHELPGTPCG